MPLVQKFKKTKVHEVSTGNFDTMLKSEQRYYYKEIVKIPKKDTIYGSSCELCVRVTVTSAFMQPWFSWGGVKPCRVMEVLYFYSQLLVA